MLKPVESSKKTAGVSSIDMIDFQVIDVSKQYFTCFE